MLNLTHRFEWGIADVFIDFDKGELTRAKIYSDALYPELINALQAGLESQRKCDESGLSVSRKVAKQALLLSKESAEPNSIPSQGEAYIDEFFDYILNATSGH